MDKLWNTIKSLIHLVENGTPSVEQNERMLTVYLDRIALLMSEASTIAEPVDQGMPELDQTVLRKQVENQFPNWGFYNSPEHVTTLIGTTDVSLGDAIDDLTDIVHELKSAVWYLENTDETRALAQLQFTYQTHWQVHLRSLQWYICCLSIGL